MPSSPPILRRSRKRRLRNLIRYLTGRQPKYQQLQPRKLFRGRRRRRLWRKNTRYYYPKPKKMADEISRAVAAEEALVRNKSKRSWRVLDRLRRRLLKEFTKGSPSPLATSRSSWDFIFWRGSRGLIGVLYSTMWELARIARVPGTSNYQSELSERLGHVSRSLHSLTRLVRRFHVMRFFPWRRRRQRRMNIAFEW